LATSVKNCTFTARTSIFVVIFEKLNPTIVLIAEKTMTSRGRRTAARVDIDDNNDTDSGDDSVVREKSRMRTSSAEGASGRPGTFFSGGGAPLLVANRVNRVFLFHTQLRVRHAVRPLPVRMRKKKKKRKKK
jgi:hypothetical protein